MILIQLLSQINPVSKLYTKTESSIYKFSCCLSVYYYRSPLAADQAWKMRYQKKARNPRNRRFQRRQNSSRTLRLAQIEKNEITSFYLG